ncbi:MAG TPA: hypothetical protein HA360_04165 [Nanoarchaeota archaeon]|nr:hypothetical protein [Candidatus Woesearchaeota archaeon]HIH15046.1 hypothetical protein [Nanoarchaeota archaeon]HIH59492.1 hypothetical protein [Nanoarchaeota archaeon]HII14243.1 hypothetical protein [Nanoarchaeota archaeon]HIJ04617.1 hypothetical protein [Nanoarchaeota archaeon]
MLEDFTAKFTQEKISFKKIGNKFFLEDKELEKAKLKQKEKYFGIYVGEEQEGNFIPSFVFLEWLAERSTEKIFVKDIGEIDFLYGKTLRSRHIDHVEGEIKIGFLKLVQNMYDENLGYGKITGDFAKTEQVLKPKVDRGLFLKREKKLKREEEKA